MSNLDTFGCGAGAVRGRRALLAWLIVVTPASLGTLACGELGRSHGDRVRRDEPTYFVHGDPMKLISGTVRSEAPIVRRSEIAKFQGFVYVPGPRFATRASRASGKDRDLEQENEVRGENTRPSSPHVSSSFAFVAQADGSYWYCSLDGCEDLHFEFATEGEGLTLRRIVKKVGSRQLAWEARSVHESLRADGTAFSILVETSSPETQKALWALYFVRPTLGTKPPFDVDKSFSYLRGRGKPTPWEGSADDEIRLSLCGAMSDGDRAILKKGALAWVRDGRVGKRRLIVDDAALVRPFSDLNQNCLTMVDDYFFEDDRSLAVLGLALPLIHTVSRRLISSHVFISRGGLVKAGYSKRSHVNTVTHEVGHFLGLDHEFARKDGRLLQRSIMSYESDIDGVTAHDIAAIEAMYGAYRER